MLAFARPSESVRRLCVPSSLAGVGAMQAAEVGLGSLEVPSGLVGSLRVVSVVVVVGARGLSRSRCAC
eukprot:2044884-Pyramimonas_sp.AAC.1